MGKWHNKIFNFMRYMNLDSEPAPRRVQISVRQLGLPKVVVVRTVQTNP